MTAPQTSSIYSMSEPQHDYIINSQVYFPNFKPCLCLWQKSKKDADNIHILRGDKLPTFPCTICLFQLLH